MSTATPNGSPLKPPTPEPARTPPPPDVAASASTSANKRKREDEPDVQQPSSNAPVSVSVSGKGTQAQHDVLEILQRYDPKPSFLAYEFDEGNVASVPSQKKPRMTNGTSKTTIFAKLSSGTYPSLTSLKDDAACVRKTLEASLRGKAGEAEAPNTNRLSIEDLKQIQRAETFEYLIAVVVDKESEYESIHDRQSVKKEVNGRVNGHAIDPKTSAVAGTGTVLTLFGNAPTPKQLFSSMQNPAIAEQQQSIKSALPVEEMSLPNGLTATKVMPIPRDDTKKGPTFEEVFAPPYSLPALQPPKAHKRSSTRDATINWEFKDNSNRSSKKAGYTAQGLTTGDWLGHGGVDPGSDALLKEKRKQRDRTLSSGAEGTKERPTKFSLEDQQAREEEALFRRAYSSFAPNVDHAKSVVPAETQSAIWWDKIGEKRFDETFAIDPALLDNMITKAAEALPAADLDDFERAVNELDDLDADMMDAEIVSSESDVEKVLREVSELLETLASHQRIRNASLPSSASASRTPLSPAPVIASRIGKPDEPAEAEILTYQALRRELAYLILKLPPYAVAKINGDQLAELGVSKLVAIEGKDYRGTMEEDQVARLAKYNAAATAAGIASLTRGNSASGQHYNTTAQRTPAIGQAANTRYGQNAQYGASRTPATQPQYQRSTSNQSYGTPSAPAPRPAYNQPPAQYTRPGAPQQTYGQPNGQQQYYQQRPAQAPNYGGYGQQYSQTPQTQPRQTFSSSQPLAQFQARSHAAAANAVAYQTANTASPGPFNRTASPATAPSKASYAQAPQQPLNVQPRPPLYPQQGPQQYAQPVPGSGRATPNYPSQPQTPVNGYQPRPPTQPVAPRATSGTPQPPQAHPPPPPGQGQQYVPQVQANGHQ
ncbi:hypothetical protein B0A50_04039 [Salinomyces thailandicus]|uniref:Uncharacterized protein n=1 Tax=Salinomyces thailandicus TaxID=706561 RepID=A0A4U0TZF5_9PEZI|nr:hypothetical protein B0A50_04039 [Salinomyces thailandica]